MSKLAAYLGPRTPLTPLLELSHPAPPAGFCCTWIAGDGNPALFDTPLALEADPNIDELARGLESRLWMTLARDVAARETRPLYEGELMLLLQGKEAPPPHLRAALMRHLAPAVELRLNRHSLGEYLLALLQQLLDNDEEMSLDSAILEALTLTTRLAGEEEVELNLALSDGERIYLARHSANCGSLPLHYCTDDERFPDAQVAASHLPEDAAFWHPLPENHLLILDRDDPPELIPL